jgi:hypothetical protein
VDCGQGSYPIDIVLAALGSARDNEKSSLRYVTNISDALLNIIAKEYPEKIKYVQSEIPVNIQKKVVEQDSSYIVTLNDPSEEVQIIALEDNPKLLKHIRNVTVAATIVAVRQLPELIKGAYWEQDPRVQMAVIESDPTDIRYIRQPSYRVQLAAYTSASSTREKIEVYSNIQDRYLSPDIRWDVNGSNWINLLKNNDPEDQSDIDHTVHEQMLPFIEDANNAQGLLPVTVKSASILSDFINTRESQKQNEKLNQTI